MTGAKGGQERPGRFPSPSEDGAPVSTCTPGGGNTAQTEVPHRGERDTNQEKGLRSLPRGRPRGERQR